MQTQWKETAALNLSAVRRTHQQRAVKHHVRHQRVSVVINLLQYGGSRSGCFKTTALLMFFN